MPSLAAQVEELLPRPDAEHVCIHCDGAPKRDRQGCIGNGVHLTGSEVSALRSAIAAALREAERTREQVEAADVLAKAVAPRYDGYGIKCQVCGKLSKKASHYDRCALAAYRKHTTSEGGE